jgi:hypothetical protein
MTTSKYLFLANLSMDAYNRGYGAGIGDGANVDENGRDLDGLGEAGFVGTARVLSRPNGIGYPAWQTVGFYAVACPMGSGADAPSELQGKTVISYRQSNF